VFLYRSFPAAESIPALSGPGGDTVTSGGGHERPRLSQTVKSIEEFGSSCWPTMIPAVASDMSSTLAVCGSGDSAPAVNHATDTTSVSSVCLLFTCVGVSSPSPFLPIGCRSIRPIVDPPRVYPPRVGRSAPRNESFRPKVTGRSAP